MPRLEVQDVGDERLCLRPLRRLRLHLHACEPRYPPPVEHRLHGDDGLELGRDRREVLLVEHPGGTGRLEHVARDRIPPPKDEVIETCQWQDLADEVLPGFRPGADLEACHLAQ